MFRTWSNIIRSLLIIVNIIAIVPGCLLIYASFKVSSDNHHRDALSNSNQSNPILTYSCIFGAALGSLIVFKSLLGLYGSIRRSKSILITYAFTLSIIVLLLTVMVVLTYTMSTHNKHNSSQLEQPIDKAYVNATMAMYNYVDTTDPKTTTIDYIQRKFSCCGVNSPNDWTDQQNQQIPKSCCSEPVESNLPTFKYCPESEFKSGCWRPLQEYLHETLVPITRDFILLKIYFNVFCIALAGLLIRSIKKDLDVV